jgi:hypothetical protein
MFQYSHIFETFNKDNRRDYAVGAGSYRNFVASGCSASQKRPLHLRYKAQGTRHQGTMTIIHRDDALVMDLVTTNSEPPVSCLSPREFVLYDSQGLTSRRPR